MKNNQHTFVVILAGGGGTRLWPKSRNKSPKQFLSLYSKKSLIQDTFDRALKLTNLNNIIVISNRAYVDEIKKQLPDLPVNNIIGEPEKKETAPAMLLGAIIAYKRDPNAVIINLASDHIITDQDEFKHVISTAIQVARSGNSLVAVGITPTFPHLGMGYIKIGQELSRIDNLPVFEVDSFSEKPDLKTAIAFLKTKKYYWNACNYVWTADSIIESFEKNCPKILKKIHPIIQSVDTPKFASKLKDAYSAVEKISIDYAISEKADNLLLVPGDFGWNDIGDWRVVYDLQPKNENRNAVIGNTTDDDVIFYDSQNNLVHANDRLIALVGMNDVVIVDTGEVFLVMDKEKSQDVKKIVEELKKTKKKYL